MTDNCLRPSWDISQYLEALVKQCRFHEARLYQFERTNQLRQHFYNLSKEDPTNILVTPTHRRQRPTGLGLKRSFDDSVDVTPLWEAAQLQDLLHTGCDPRLKSLIFLGTKLHSHHPDTPLKSVVSFTILGKPHSQVGRINFDDSTSSWFTTMLVLILPRSSNA